MQFAEWICDVHEQPCHVVYTDFRPTPLQHYLFPIGGDGIYMVVNERSEFKEENFHRAMALISENRREDPTDSKSRKNRKGKSSANDKSVLLGPSYFLLPSGSHQCIHRPQGYPKTRKNDHIEELPPGYRILL